MARDITTNKERGNHNKWMLKSRISFRCVIVTYVCRLRDLQRVGGQRDRRSHVRSRGPCSACCPPLHSDQSAVADLHVRHTCINMHRHASTFISMHQHAMHAREQPMETCQIANIPPKLCQISRPNYVRYPAQTMSDIPLKLCQISRPNYVRYPAQTMSDIPPKLCQISRPNYVKYPAQTMSDIPPKLCQISRPNYVKYPAKIVFLSKRLDDVATVTEGCLPICGKDLHCVLTHI